MQNNKRKFLLSGLAFMLAYFFFSACVALLLWNQLAAPLFGWPTLDFFQIVGLMILFRLLTGGFGFRGRGPGYGKAHYMRERWKRMTEEEQERFK